MECSHAVLMLMLLVPCDQPGGETPEGLSAADSELRVVIQAEAVSESAPVPAAAEAAAAKKSATRQKRLPSADTRVTN